MDEFGDKLVDKVPVNGHKKGARGGARLTKEGVVGVPDGAIEAGILGIDGTELVTNPIKFARNTKKSIINSNRAVNELTAPRVRQLRNQRKGELRQQNPNMSENQIRRQVDTETPQLQKQAKRDMKTEVKQTRNIYSKQIESDFGNKASNTFANYHTGNMIESVFNNHSVLDIGGKASELLSNTIPFL